MGQLLAVHNEKVRQEDRIDAVLFEKIESVISSLMIDEIKKGCERDIRLLMTVLGSWRRRCGQSLVLCPSYPSLYPPGQASASPKLDTSAISC